MTSRLNRVEDEVPAASSHPPISRPRVDYNMACSDVDPIPDPSLLDPIDEPQNVDDQQAIDGMLKTARKNGINDANVAILRKLVSDHMEISRTGRQAAHLQW